MEFSDFMVPNRNVEMQLLLLSAKMRFIGRGLSAILRLRYKRRPHFAPDRKLPSTHPKENPLSGDV